jgi:hypothetical protein
VVVKQASNEGNKSVAKRNFSVALPSMGGCAGWALLDSRLSKLRAHEAAY